jgi:uncharacterized protein (DUF305 family)
MAAALALANPAVAQDTSGSGRTLPEICTKDFADQTSAHTMGGMHPAADQSDMSGMPEMDKPHQDLMAGMADMNKNMMEGHMAKDIDVAFVCSMIPHHQGAIDMAKAELAHGDDAWAKEMAQKVIDAQEKEIADMVNWLKEQK